jgi:hypothetical protein
MALINFLETIGNIIFAPIKLATDWAREPLNGRALERQLILTQNEIEAMSTARKEEAAQEADLTNNKKKLEAELHIQKETDVKRILAEIDEFRKDKEFERMKAVSDAIMEYQQQLTRLNVSAINAIGHMQLDLREKAQDLVYKNTIKYKELQDAAYNQAVEDFLKIETQFSENEMAKNILYKSVDERLANIIKTAQNFLIELNNDIAVLNKSINILTERGQSFIEQHLDHFHVNDNILRDNRQTLIKLENILK